MLSEGEQLEIIEGAKGFFREKIAQQHVRNTNKCKKVSEFNVNPFLATYLARYLTGGSDPVSIAKGLIYPRVLGTSITTSFGSNIQYFCSNVFPESIGSAISGIDIEFMDSMDGRRKYCQVKAGPNTINSDDVETIFGKFQSLIGVARTNHLQVGVDDMVVGILYGTPNQLSQHYKKINERYPVLVGDEFWHRLTGSRTFYQDLINAVGEVALEVDGADLLDEVVTELARDIERQGL
jgi:hypothetical protein